MKKLSSSRVKETADSSEHHWTHTLGTGLGAISYSVDIV